MDWSQYKNFTEDEFRCSHCGKSEMDDVFMDKLQAMRTEAGFPFKVNSGYRCPEYNASISSTGKNGPHTTGRAVDIGVRGSDAYEVARLAYSYGMTGMGFKQHGEGRFIHLDDLSTPPRPNIWSYP